MRLLISALTALILFATPVVAGEREQKLALAHASYELGMRHPNDNVPGDDAKAVYNFRTAAELGLAEAQHYLGTMYDKGEGVLEDYVQASWWSIAATRGLKGAKKNKDIVEKR